MFQTFKGISFAVAVIFGCSKKKMEDTSDEINLNLRVHLMRGTPWVHPTRVSMESWVTKQDVSDTIFPEINSIWSQANITWNSESIVEENIVVGSDYQTAVDYIVNSARDDEGVSDPNRLPYLYGLMQPDNRSSNAQLGTNLFHVYVFPFTGNTSQGNAMAGLGYHTVVGQWSNKHTDSESPEKMYLTEDHSKFVRGSLSATIAHELGHVVGLSHNECKKCLMSSSGYSMTDTQIETARAKATNRVK